MDIHPPMGRLDSIREAGAHIVIVTIGILIALGLEGARESWREHVAVRDARESFQQELRLDADQLVKDEASLDQVDSKVGKVVAEMPGLTKSPSELQRQVSELNPGFYFFRTTAWEAALSSGALTHMDHAELNRYMDAYLSVKNYQEASRGVVPAWMAVQTYFNSHHSYKDEAEVAAGEEKLRNLQMGIEIMKHLGGEMSAGIQEAVKNN